MHAAGCNLCSDKTQRELVWCVGGRVLHESSEDLGLNLYLAMETHWGCGSWR